MTRPHDDEKTENVDSAGLAAAPTIPDVAERLPASGTSGDLPVCAHGYYGSCSVCGIEVVNIPARTMRIRMAKPKILDEECECHTVTHCQHWGRCLAECTPEDLIATGSVPSLEPAVELGAQRPNETSNPVSLPDSVQVSRQEKDNDLGGHEPHGGRSDIEPAASPQLPHDAIEVRLMGETDPRWIDEVVTPHVHLEQMSMTEYVLIVETGTERACFSIHACNSRSHIRAVETWREPLPAPPEVK